jgi:hypothetical protein
MLATAVFLTNRVFTNREPLDISVTRVRLYNRLLDPIYCHLIVALNLNNSTSTFHRLRLLSAALLSLSLSLTHQSAYAACEQAGARASGPEIVIEKTEQNYGEVFAGEELEAAFVVRNVGTKPLTLAEKSDLAAGQRTRNTLATAAWRVRESYTASAAGLRAAPS